MTVIKVENLSKQYRLGTIGTGTLAHDVNRWWHKVRGKEDPYLKVGEINDRTEKSKSDYVWALRDINFEIEQGEVVGIIGRNGAGKSTLLKILSRTTLPTTGSIKIKGRVASLLEVGTGFHPELTGRENIFLNGAILGMRKTEIKSKFDEIVDFAGVDKYVDTPVKRYSSGMYVRLAFAVAAHLDPEILIVDEVLAVGDAEFQKKALGKMKDVSKGEGRTVLFVSHNMAAINTLCTQGLLLEHGKLKLNASVEKCTSYYLNGANELLTYNKVFSTEYGNDDFKLNEICVKNSNREYADTLLEDLPIELETKITFYNEDAHRYHITYHLHNEAGEPLFSFYDTGAGSKIKRGENRLTCTFPSHFFQPGTFYLSIYVVIDKRSSVFSEKDIFSFTVADAEREMGTYMGREPGYIRPKFIWTNL